MSQDFHTAKIVGVTRGVGDLSHLAPEALLVHMARVSNPDGQRKAMAPDRLIRYLIRRREWSPLDMVQVDMEILTTRDISRQHIRHWSMRFQEFSQRYADVSVLPDAPYRPARMRHPTNRQASVECEDPRIATWWKETQDRISRQTWIAYRDALDQGIAPEVARAVLPEGLTATVYFAAGSLRTWLHYCQLRLDSYTDDNGDTVHPAQDEHRKIAASAWEALRGIFPATVEAVEGLG